jgi:hypothetical protein
VDPLLSGSIVDDRDIGPTCKHKKNSRRKLIQNSTCTRHAENFVICRVRYRALLLYNFSCDTMSDPNTVISDRIFIISISMACD